MITVISHADDLGMNAANDEAILEAAAAGQLSEISCLVVLGLDAKRASTYSIPPHVVLGLHFCLTEGLLAVSSRDLSGLAEPTDSLTALALLVIRLQAGLVKEETIEKELIAQLERFKHLFGRYPRHVDSHQHVHLFQPVAKVVRRVCKEYSVESLRTSKRYLVGRKASPISPVLNVRAHATARHLALPRQNVADAMFDPRFPTRGSVRDSLAALPDGTTVEIIWHLSTDPAEGWRHAERELILSGAWREGLDIEMGTYAPTE